MGLVILGALALYFLISFGVVAWAISYARKHGKSAKRWGWSAAFIMYSLVFWDWIPTVAVHQYYCAKDSGFWVYKTLDQWKAENPGVMEGLVMKLSVQATPYGDLQIMNERFAIETHRSKPIPFLPTSIAKRLLVDQKTGDVLAKGVDVGSGVGYMATGGGFKFWLNQEPCIARDFSKLSFEIENSRRTK
jgi:hypothetical protein